MDFDKVLLKAPGLVPMMNDAFHMRNAPPISKNRYWYRILKPQMVKLVGFSAVHPELTSTEIYDKTYQLFIGLMGI